MEKNDGTWKITSTIWNLECLFFFVNKMTLWWHIGKKNVDDIHLANKVDGFLTNYWFPYHHHHFPCHIIFFFYYFITIFIQNRHNRIATDDLDLFLLYLLFCLSFLFIHLCCEFFFPFLKFKEFSHYFFCIFLLFTHIILAIPKQKSQSSHWYKAKRMK